MSHTDLLTSDEGVPTAVLATIDFALLETRDPQELQSLLRACQTQGFFYINFDNSEQAKKIVEGKDRVLEFMRTYFDQPLEVKMKDYQSVMKGYVPFGTFSGVDKGSTRSFEHIALSRYDFLHAPANLAPAVQAQRDLFKSYLELNTYASTTILAALSDVLNLSANAQLDRGHNPDRPCDTIMAMLSYPPGVGDTHQQHTDIGTLTILFSHEWGLQVLSPETNRWEFIQPRKRHAVFNVGDALRFISDHTLYSCVHRVVRATGAYACEQRFSLAFLLRPEHDFKYKDPSGRMLTAREWLENKYEVYSTPHNGQDNGKLLGGMASVLSLPDATTSDK